ncbi:trypsin-like cysteine/serine peptidase domain-containing protein [Hyaloraphidium curvatum]|nr:trypsin-like cysteine/serine peptidase domain-containing protein [Hyaloraphidium curvatum]
MRGSMAVVATLIFALAPLVALASDGVGNAGPHNPSIVGGTNVTSTDAYPWFSGIFQRNGAWNGCGAVLVLENVAITAAHCVHDGAAADDPAGLMVSTYRLNNSKSTREEGGTDYPVKSVNVHPQYDNNTLAYDLAVLVLDPPSYSGGKPAVYAAINTDANIPAPGTLAFSMGWGSTQVYREGPYPEASILQQMTSNTMANADCENQAAYVLCSNAGPGRDLCDGDSGGPLVIEVGGSPVLVGANSFVQGNPPCGNPINWFGTARVSYFTSWIRGIIDSNPPPAKPSTTTPPPVKTTQRIVRTTTKRPIKTTARPIAPGSFVLSVTNRARTNQPRPVQVRCTSGDTACGLVASGGTTWNAVRNGVKVPVTAGSTVALRSCAKNGQRQLCMSVDVAKNAIPYIYASNCLAQSKSSLTANWITNANFQQFTVVGIGSSYRLRAANGQCIGLDNKSQLRLFGCSDRRTAAFSFGRAANC